MVVRRLGLVAALAVAACAAPPPSARIAVAPGGVPTWRESPSEAMKAPQRPAETPVLLGLLSRDVEGIFGRPRFVRRDGPAQIWQYGTEICTLNLFLFREGPALKVRHVEFRGRNADLATSGACEGSLISMAQPQTP